MRRKTKKTAKVLQSHARRRAFERFDIVLSDADFGFIHKSVKEGRAEFFDRQSNIVTRWIVTLQDQRVAVVYDKIRHSIRTVMPVDYLTQGQLEGLLRRGDENDHH
jgi:hypothetical protein